jgi:F-type H+-transporting ATPase subunit a
MAVSTPPRESPSRGGIPSTVLLILGLALIIVGALFPFFHVALAPVEIAPKTLFTVAGFPVTNSFITAWITIIIWALFFGLATRSMSVVPRGAQNLAETIVEALLGLAENVAGRERGREFFALFATIFLFVLCNNWLELLPGFTNATICLEPPGTSGCTGDVAAVFRSPSADLNFTIALALIAMFMVQFWGIKHTGFGGWIGKFINLSAGPIGFVVGILELLSEFSRIISFSFRLFGNLFAGEVLLSVIPFLIPWVIVLPFMGLEVFVGLIQALIFALLTLAFIVMSTTVHGGSHEAGGLAD